MLTRSHPSAWTAADYIAISTVCTTKLQTRPRLSIEISAHFLEPSVFFASSDISSILWVKCCLGNSEHSRLPEVDRGERHCEEALELQFSVRRAPSKKRPAGEKRRRC